MFYKSVLEAVKAITKIVPDDYLDAKQDHFKILIPMIWIFSKFPTNKILIIT